MMRVRASHVVMGALALVMLASCGIGQKLRPKKGLFFDGHQFRARSEKAGEEREDFIVTVARASQSAQGAREAGRHEANSYCIRNYGRSDMKWAPGQGPDDENIAARIVDDKLVLRGRCDGW